MLVAIIGVETYFGQRTGKYRVLDSLATLAFAYPPRAKFFSGELEQFLLLTREEGLDPKTPLGSYAGAMGAGQFIPSSFRTYAVDGDGDGKRDIWTDWADVLGSIANYFKKSGWKTGEPVVDPATRSSGVERPGAEQRARPRGNRRLAREAGLRVHDERVARRAGGRVRARGARRQLGVLDRISQLPRDHALQPQPEVRACRTSARSSDSFELRGDREPECARHRGRCRRRRARRARGPELSPVTRAQRGSALVVVLAAMAFQCGCASNAPVVRPRGDGAVDAGGASPRNDRGNPPFYDVLGRRYYVLPTSEGYRARGVASWYGRDFHGLATSSGETYNMNAMTAAHTTLPIPTWVQVTNLENGKHVVVKVNDRGPFVDDRLIDLSYAAALQLDMVRNGTARVEVRALAPPPGAPPLPTPSPAPQVTVAQLSSPPPDSSLGAVAGITLISSADAAPSSPGSAAGGSATNGQSPLFAQVGAFGDRTNAARLVERLRANGFVNAFVVTEGDGRRALHRVRLGPLRDDQEFDQVRARLRSLGFGESQLVTAR